MTKKQTALATLLSTAAAVAATAAAATSQAQRFTLSGTTIRGHDSPIHVVATGPISGAGTAVDTDGRNRDDLTFRLPHGTVSLTSRDAATSAHPNLRTCTATLVVHGTFRIVGGTGAYAHATGSGTYVRHDRLVGTRGANGKCLGRNARPKAVYDHLTMTGTARIG